jgi:uncharacterized membrane protein
LTQKIFSEMKNTTLFLLLAVIVVIALVMYKGKANSYKKAATSNGGGSNGGGSNGGGSNGGGSNGDGSNGDGSNGDPVLETTNKRFARENAYSR